MSDVDVTVSIVNHENRDAVLESLAALASDAGRAARVEIVVVDNVSQDGSAEAIAERFPDVDVVVRDERAGYGANHNVALGRARGRHVLFLNDDTRVRPGTIDALCAHLDARPDVGVAVPTIVDGSGRVVPSLWRRPSPWVDVAGPVGLVGPMSAGAGDRPVPVGWATGCALLVRRDAARAVGGFDEGYFMYSEEVDLCTRLADAGHATHWVPDAAVVHEGQLSTGAESPERAVEMARSRRRYWRRHYSPAGRVVAQTATSLRFAVLAVLARLRAGPAHAYALQAAGCWREPGRPGLRERAEEFNRRRAGAGA